LTNKTVFLLVSLLLIGCHVKVIGRSGEKGHRIYNKLPCYFNGAKVQTSPNAATLGPKGGRCCPTCTGYKEKRGLSIIVPRGTPVVAITDMKLYYAQNKSAERNSRGLTENKDYRKKHRWVGIMKPYDDLHLLFIDKRGNNILYYHLMSTPLVPGFDKGKCKRPKEYGTETWKRIPVNCGGYAYRTVKKGDVIGLSGDTGGGHEGDKHFSLGIQVANSVGFKEWVNPEEYFKWENLPSESDAYLLPVQSKKYLKKIGSVK
jgi:murein DD-endopeptidase MepM/ murein hydrolase activator NlpD